MAHTDSSALSTSPDAMVSILGPDEPTWIDHQLRELEQLRLDVDANLRMRPLTSTAATFPLLDRDAEREQERELESPLTAYYTPQVAYFSHANLPLPISAQSLFTRMQCSPRPLLLDVRAADSYNAFHLRGAIRLQLPTHPELIPFSDFADINTFVPTAIGRAELNQLILHGDWDGDAVLYDDERTLPANDDEPTPTWRIMQYLIPLVKGQVWYLEGGMSAASTLPHFQLVVVTAEQTQTSPAFKTKTTTKLSSQSLNGTGSGKTMVSLDPPPPPAPPSTRLILSSPPSARKRSVPNLRKIDTSSAQMTLPKQTLHISTQSTPASSESSDGSLLQLPAPQKLSLSTRKTPTRITISAPTTPRAGSPTSLPPTAKLQMNGSPSSFVLSTIIPSFLYLGQEPTTPGHLSSLKREGIKRILNVAAECDDDQGLNLKGEFERYIRIPLRDMVEERGVEEFLQKVCGILDDARLHDAPVYVHCRAGKSRSVMAVIAYLIHSYFWTLSKAYAFVLERREGISPNIGFVSELMRWEEAELGAGKKAGISNSSQYAGSAIVDKGAEGDGFGFSYHHGGASPVGLPTKRPSKVRESLPPFLSISSSSQSTAAVPQIAAAKAREGAEEMEVRDARGRYRHQRRAPVDDVTLQPLRRVSKAGLESSLAAIGL